MATPALAPRARSDQRCWRRSHRQIVDPWRDFSQRRQRWNRLLDQSQELPASGRKLPARRLPQNERLAEDVEIGCTRSDALRQVRPVSAAGN